jgi:hypothetical protein
MIAFALSLVFVLRSQAQTAEPIFPEGELAWRRADEQLCLYRCHYDSNGKTIWLEPISDKDYNNVK